MRSKTNPNTPRRLRGPSAKHCRTCGDLHPVGALTFGQCADCAGLVALPLRGEGGRFISFIANTTSASTTSVQGGGLR